MATLQQQLKDVRTAKKQVSKFLFPFATSQKKGVDFLKGVGSGINPALQRAGRKYAPPQQPTTIEGKIGGMTGKRVGELMTAGRYAQSIPQSAIGILSKGKININKYGYGLNQKELEDLGGLDSIPKRIAPTTKKVYQEVFKPMANTATLVKNKGAYIGAGAFGVGAQVVSNAQNKQPLTKDLKKGFEQGTDNAWMFAMTNKATDKVLQRFGGTKFIETSLSKAWKEASVMGIKQGGERFLQDVGKLWGKQVLRGMMETPAEAGAFTVKRMLERDDNLKDAFIEEFSSALIGNIIYHGGFSGLRTSGIGGKELVKQATEKATEYVRTLDPAMFKSEAGFFNPMEAFRITPKPEKPFDIPKMEFSTQRGTQPKPIPIDELVSGTTGNKSFRGEIDNTISRYLSGNGTERQLKEDATFIDDIFQKEAPAKIKQAVGENLNGKIAYLQKQMNFQEGGKGIKKVREVLDGAKRLMKNQDGFINIGADVGKKGDIHDFTRGTSNVDRNAKLFGGEQATGYGTAQGKFSATFDKKPRFEIDDSKARIKDTNIFDLPERRSKLSAEISPLNTKWWTNKASPDELKKLDELTVEAGRLDEIIASNKKELKLGDIFSHDEAYKNYPELRNIKVKLTTLPALQGRGSYDEVNKVLTLDKQTLRDNFDDSRQTILHEIQHAIQSKENFARGGSPQALGMENYLKQGGELESRSVANRADLTPEQRRTTLPYKDQGIKPEDVITRFDDGGVQGSIKPNVANPLLSDIGKSVDEVLINDKELANINKGTARAEIGREMLNDGTETIYLSEIINSTKGNKNASQLLDDLIKYADETNTPISLRANVSNNFTDGKGLNQQQLVEWYKRKGFESANDLSDFAGDKDFMVHHPSTPTPQGKPSIVQKAKEVWKDQRGFINIGADVTPKLKTGEGQGYTSQTPELSAKSSSDSIIPQDNKTLLDQAQKTLAPEKFDPGNAGMFKKVKESINSKFTGLRETVQDKMIRVKQLQDTPGAKVSDNSDPYLKEELYHGRIATRLEQVKNEATEIEKGIIDTSKKANFDIDATRALVNKYLHAVHTPERNAKLGDGASGMKTAEAERIIKEIDGSPAGKVIKEFADKALELNRKTLDILKEAEVIDEGLYDTLRKTYKNHVPLQRVFEDTKALNEALTERGFSVKGTGIKRAKGSELQVDDILTNIYSNVQSAYVRAEKNRIDLATLRFARENKDLFGDLFKEVKPKAIGMGFGEDPKPILERINDPLVLQLREKGKPVYLQINDPAIAKAFQGVGQEKMPGFLKGVGAITRFYSGLHTRFNPEFAIPNLVRDSQEMAIFMASQKNTGFKGAFKALGSNMGYSQKAIIEHMQGKNTEGAKLYKQLLEDGGTTGGMSLSTRSKVEADVKDILTTYRSKPKLLTKKLFQAIDGYNTIIEDGTRLAVYKTALSQGMSREQSASMAKNATINFNRKGTAGPIINSLYMFSNASIQGSAKMLKAMKNPKVAGAVVTSVGGAVFTVSAYNDKIDPDWREKVSEWDRTSNLVVMLPPGKDGKTRYMTVPVSWGLKPINAFFNTAYDTMAGKNKSVYDSATKIAGSILDAYNPVGGQDIASGVTPTLLDPFLETARNKKWSGSMIKPDWKKGLPGSEQVFDNTKDKLTGKIAIGLSKGVEKATDRNVNISPEMIKYTFEQNIGGVGRFGSKTLNTITSIGQGKLPDADETPFLSRFMRTRSKEESDRYVKKSKEKDFIQSLKKYDTGSDEQKKYMREYLQQFNPDQRESIMFKVREEGFNTAGVGTSDKVLRAQLYLDQMEDNPDAVIEALKNGQISPEMDKEINKQLEKRIKALLEKKIEEAQ